MRAYVLHSIGDFGMEEVRRPVPGDGEVLLAVKAAGICGSDLPRLYRTGTYSYPLVPGHEFAGVVVETGAGAEPCLIGSRVGVFPLMPCKSCDPCREKRYELCRRYGYLGSRTDGGFADYVKVPVWNLLELPQTVSFEAAAMMEPMAVAVHALRRTGLADIHVNGGTVVICGLGTIGLLTLMFLMEIGRHNVLVIGNKDNQKALVKEMGIAEAQFCDVRTEDVQQWMMDKTDGKGVDVFFDCVGKNETLLYGLQGTAPGGHLQIIGNPVSHMQIEKDIYWKILRNQLTLSGSWNSSFQHEDGDDWSYVLEKVANGRVKPERLISHRFLFHELGKGFELMKNKSEEYIKVMGIW